MSICFVFFFRAELSEMLYVCFWVMLKMSFMQNLYFYNPFNF